MYVWRGTVERAYAAAMALTLAAWRREQNNSGSHMKKKLGGKFNNKGMVNMTTLDHNKLKRSAWAKTKRKNKGSGFKDDFCSSHLGEARWNIDEEELLGSQYVEACSLSQFIEDHDKLG